jgi:4-alpha-glucanotransferase
LLVKDGLLSKEDLETLKLPFGQVSFRAVKANKEKMLKKAYLNFAQNERNDSLIEACDFERFCTENLSWLEDYALFKAIEESTGKPWYSWPSPLRNRDENSLDKKKDELKELVDRQKFVQFMFSRQWRLFHEYCQTKDVRILGDLPFYMSYDCADIWCHPELFKLNTKKQPLFVAGVPPDYFCRDGQYWGNPVYNLKELERTRFQWWIQRIRRNLELCDVLRLDHFRGFTAYWQIPATSKTARNGRWIRSPAKSFFKALYRSFPDLPFVAEDLGLITDRVRRNLNALGIPGMRVLLFGFGGKEDNPNSPESHTENSVVYTGTHDTNTVKGWFRDEASNKEKEQLFRCLGKQVRENEVSREFIKLSLASKSNLSIIPLQDLLSLGAEARMNLPGKQVGNWVWRVKSGQLQSECFEELGRLTEAAGRNLL